MKEFNDSINPTNPIATENNAPVGKTTGTEFNVAAEEREKIAENPAISAEYNETATKASPTKKEDTTALNVITNTNFVKVATYVAAIIGFTLVSTAFTTLLGLSNASFYDVYAEQSYIVMMVKIEQWSENMAIKISYNDVVDYLEVYEPEPRIEEEYEEPIEEEDEFRNVYYYSYYLEDITGPTLVKIELLGDKVLLSDVLDTRIITVEAPIDYAEAYIEEAYDEITAIGGTIVVDKWKESLQLAFDVDGVTVGTFSIPSPDEEHGQDGSTGGREFYGSYDQNYYYFIYYKDDLEDGAEVTVRVMDGDYLLDNRKWTIVIPAEAYFDEAYRDGMLAGSIVVDSWKETLVLSISIDGAKVGEYAIPSPEEPIDEPIGDNEFNGSYDGSVYYFSYYSQTLEDASEATFDLYDGTFLIDTRTIELA